MSETETASQKSSRLEILGGMVASFITASWLVGYAIWVSYALRHDLGWLDPWDMKGRAVMSGLLPALLLAAFYPLVFAVPRLYRWSQRDAKPWEEAFGGGLKLLGVVLLVLFFLFDLFGSSSNPWVQRLLVGWVVCWVMAALFSGRRTDRAHKVLAVGWLALTVSMFLATAVGVYSWLIFPELPQEIGGPGSRCAVLEVDPGGITTRTAALLGSEGADGRTAPLELILETESTLYVRTPESDAGQTYLRLDRGAIRGMLSCPAE